MRSLRSYQEINVNTLSLATISIPARLRCYSFRQRDLDADLVQEADHVLGRFPEAPVVVSILEIKRRCGLTRLARDVYAPLLDAPPKQPDDAMLDRRAQQDSMVFDRRRLPGRGEIDQRTMRACHRRPIDPRYLPPPILVQRCISSEERYWSSAADDPKRGH